MDGAYEVRCKLSLAYTALQLVSTEVRGYQPRTAIRDVKVTRVLDFRLLLVTIDRHFVRFQANEQQMLCFVFNSHFRYV